MPTSRTYLFFALVSAWLAGCQHATVASKNEGTSSFRFLEPPPPPAKQGDVSTEEPCFKLHTINPQPLMPLAMPEYPASALAAHAGPATVVVRITVDTEGRVAEVRPSLMNLVTPSRHAADFQAAVEAALAQWRFRPAEVRHLERVKDPGGDFQRMTKREKVEWMFEIEFAFNGPGSVLSGVPK